MSSITMQDGTHIHYKDWGNGPVVIFSHGWPLNADSWESQMFHLASNGYRCIAHDRRGHGRSDQPWHGNDMDTYADDLACIIDTLGVDKVILVGFSAGGGEVARYIGRHGTQHVSKIVLIASVPPLMLRTPDNPEGLPRERYDGNRLATLTDRSQLYRDIASGPFYGADQEGAEVSQGMIDAFWRQGMQAGLKNTYDCIAAFSETNFTEDLKKFDVPTLLIHGDFDQIVPISTSSQRAAKLIPNATLMVYPGGPHGLLETHKTQLNHDLLTFIQL